MTALPIALMSDDEVARFGRVDTREAGFGALTTPAGALPLTAMEVDARVTGIVAAIELAQTFVNTHATPIEGTYIFPLPDRAAVHRFRMEVAGRVIEGVVDERGAAREQYDEAIAAGHRAAITEEERPGVFTMRVGNLMPGETATVRLSLVGPLPVDDGEVTFRFPLVVAPRYMPGASLGGDQAGLGRELDTSLVPDASRISPPTRLPGSPNAVRLGIRVAFAPLEGEIHDVASSLHAVSESLADARVIALAAAERLDRDFVLRWRIDGAALQSSLACVDDADGAGGTFLMTLVPPSTTTLAARPRDVVFVIDRSGSMGGWKMVAARRAAARMIDTLTSRDRFCAVAFDDRIDGLPDLQLVDATDRNRFRTVEALAQLDARGGTELEQPLAHAAGLLAGGHDDRERVIVLVTDGQVGNEDHILRGLAPRLKATRMFALGIDQAVNAAFLRRLAAAGGGLCELVESEDRLDAVMAKVHRRIGLPVATELALAAEGIAIEAAETAPSKLPDVYAGAPVTVLGRYRGRAASNASIAITGTSLGEPLAVRVVRTRAPAVAVTPAATSWLGASWARARIRDLEDRYAAGDGSLEGAIVAVSKRHGVLSRFTAFLAVDRSAIANPGGKLLQVVQPVEAPAGWESAPAPGAMWSPHAAPTGGAMSTRSMMAGGAMPASPMVASPRGGVMASVGGAGGMRSGPPVPPPAPSAPAAPSPMPRMATPKRSSAATQKAEAADASGAQGGIAEAYRASLAKLAGELEAQVRAHAAPAALRVLRQRLVEWSEDVRSTGTGLAVSVEVDRLVARLTAAIALGASGEPETLAIAGELARIAGSGDGPDPDAPAPPDAPKRSRLAFWK